MLTRRNDSVTIGDVLSAFPLSRFGNYHIRFRRNTTTSYEWIEPQEVDDPCPTYNGGIFLKVLNLDKMERGITRIPIEESIPEENMEIPPDEETDTLNEDPLDFDFGAPETAPSAETIHSPAETYAIHWFVFPVRPHRRRMLLVTSSTTSSTTNRSHSALPPPRRPSSPRLP